MKKTIFLFLIALLTLTAKAEDIKIMCSMPAYDWGLQVKLKDFEINEMLYTNDAKLKKWGFITQDRGVYITIFLHRLPSPISNDKCREYFLNNSKKSGMIQDSSEVFFYYKEFAGVDYYYKKTSNENPTKSRHLYLVKDDVAIDIHYSKSNYKVSDSAYFQSLVDCFEFVPEYTDAVFENCITGIVFYNNKRYETAITYFEETLKANHIKQKLEKEPWSILIDNLGMAYALTGKIEKAKEVFQNAIKQCSDCPNFYYNLACCFAEENDFEKTIDNLILANKYKSNSIKGELLPDPMKDNSFIKYILNEQFIKVAQELNK